MYYTWENDSKHKKGIYIGADPNLKYKKCFIIGEVKNVFNVKIFDEYLGDFEVSFNKKDILLT